MLIHFISNLSQIYDKQSYKKSFSFFLSLSLSLYYIRKGLVLSLDFDSIKELKNVKKYLNVFEMADRFGQKNSSADTPRARKSRQSRHPSRHSPSQGGSRQ